MAKQNSQGEKLVGLTETKRLLGQYDLRPRKGLGQNFLISEVHLQKIVEAAELSPTDTVIEVGPGLGVLSRALAESLPNGNLICVELDRFLIPLLNKELAKYAHVQIIQSDILKRSPGSLLSEAGLFAATQLPFPDKIAEISLTALEELVSQPPHKAQPNYKVVANLPYYITSEVMIHFLTGDIAPSMLVLMVQREVAERMAARPPEMNRLAVITQFYTTPTIMTRVPAGAFYPPPNVESAVIRLVWRDTPIVPITKIEEAAFFQLVKVGFSQPRKQILNNISGGLVLPRELVSTALRSVEIDPQRRAETINLGEWANLLHALPTQISKLTF